jgi:hypothetical protein
MTEPERPHEGNQRDGNAPEPDDKAYRSAARLLGQKLGVDWRTLDAEQVREYMRKIEIARRKRE